MSAGYVATFERIGRRHDVPPLTVDSADPDAIAEAVWAYARQFLGSRWFDVVVDLAELRGSIEFGRFGKFTLASSSPDGTAQ
jgi:hypothetical protein